MPAPRAGVEHGASEHESDDDGLFDGLDLDALEAAAIACPARDGSCNKDGDEGGVATCCDGDGASENAFSEAAQGLPTAPRLRGLSCEQLVPCRESAGVEFDGGESTWEGCAAARRATTQELSSGAAKEGGAILKHDAAEVGISVRTRDQEAGESGGGGGGGGGSAARVPLNVPEAECGVESSDLPTAGSAPDDARHGRGVAASIGASQFNVGDELQADALHSQADGHCGAGGVGGDEEREGKEEEEREEDVCDESLLVSTEEEPAMCGIRIVWVHRRHRRKGMSEDVCAGGCDGSM